MTTIPSPQTQASRQRGGFSMVELLVVITIIAVLTALVLPSLNRSRDVAREIKCMGNMRQIFTYSAAFRNDHGAIMPNSMFAKYPEGFHSGNYRPSANAPAATRWMPSDADDKEPVLFGHILINKGYMPDFRVPKSDLNWSKKSRSTVFFCPTMFLGRAGEYDTRPTATTGKILDPIERRSGIYYNDVDETRVLHNATTAPKMANGYSINEMAGGQGLRLAVSADVVPNRGFYKRKHWKSQSEEQIGYLFENFMWTTGGMSDYIDYITTSSPNYGPPIRHNNYSSTNLTYADGHAVKFPTPTFLNAAAISDTLHPVSFRFE